MDYVLPADITVSRGGKHVNHVEPVSFVDIIDWHFIVPQTVASVPACD